jgi:hypothetical protein
MSETHTTEIDDRYRPGALRGLVKPHERYEVEKVSEYELNFRRLLPAKNPPVKLIKRGGLTLLSRGKVLLQSEIDRALEGFP